jgi:hypothetical protein
MRLSALWATVSLAAQSIMGCSPVDVSQAGVVEEMVVGFQERAEWCSRLELSSLRVCDLVLGPVDDRVHLVAWLEEVVMSPPLKRTVSPNQEHYEVPLPK